MRPCCSASTDAEMRRGLAVTGFATERCRKAAQMGGPSACNGAPRPAGPNPLGASVRLSLCALSLSPTSCLRVWSI